MRWWHQLVAVLADALPGGVATLGGGLVTVALLTGVLWYYWPAWLPRGRRGEASTGPRKRWRRPRWRWPFRRGFWRRFGRWWSRLRLRWRWRRRPPREPAPAVAPEPVELAPDELPDLPAQQLTMSADELAAQGRYKEAVRERLRAMVRALVERELLDYRPGWTVTELTTRAAAVYPSLAEPLRAAGELFSRIWYGGRPATAADDARMREYQATVAALLTGGLVAQRQVSR